MTHATSDVDDTARAVLDILAAPGDGTLPSLTREELFTLSDEPVLAHGADRQWWQSLSDDGRELVAQTAQRGLVARNLLTAAADVDGLSVDDRVCVILRARREPAWLVVMGEPADSDVQIVANGIDLEPDVSAAALVSARLEGVYLNRLVAATDAVPILVDWLLREPRESSGRTGRTVEIVRPRHPDAVEEVTATRAIVLGAGGAGWVIADVDADTSQPGEPRTADRPGLIDWLTAEIGLIPASS